MNKVRISVIIMLTLLLSLPISAALMNRYSFNQAGDPNAIDSVGGKTGVLAATATQASGNLVLDGTATSYVSLPSDVLGTYTSASVETWFTLTSASGWTRIFDFGDTNGNDGGYYWFYTPTGNSSRLVISTGGFPGWSTGEQVAAAPAALVTATSYHLVCVYDAAAAQMRIYQNGVEVSNAAVTMLLSDVHRTYAYIGGSVYPNDPKIAGSIKEFRIYNTALNLLNVTLNAQVGPDSYSACALTDMSPTNDATNVAIPTALSWTPAAGITVDHYEVFIKTDPNVLDPNAFPVPAGTPDYSGPLTTYTKTGLPNLSVRYWRVDTIATDTTRYIGPRFKFTTAPATPVFTVQPGFSAAFPGGSVVLTATASSATGLSRSVQWYTAANAELTTGGDITIAESTVGALTTSTLTINNVALATEGNYYAKATNAGGSTNSANGKVIIKRLFAYYPFEGNANDASGNGLNGTAATLGVTPNNVLPTYSAGKVGQAVNLANTYANYIDLPDGFADFRSGITFNLWAYPTVAGNWANFIQFSNVSGTTPAENIFFTRNGTSQTLQFRTAIGTTQGNSINGNVAIVLNQWQMFTVTMDTAGVTKLYKNGVRYFYYNNDGTVNLPQVTVSMPINVTRVNNYIGKSAWADNYFTGQMDEVRVYNYALTDNEIAQQYITDAALTSVCQTKPAYDFSGDCKEALTDLAAMATQWLQCGLYPSTACN